MSDLASKEVRPAFVLSPMMVGHPVSDLASKEVRPELVVLAADLVELEVLVADRAVRP